MALTQSSETCGHVWPLYFLAKLDLTQEFTALPKQSVFVGEGK